MARGYSLAAMSELFYPCNYTDLGSAGPDLDTLRGDNNVGIYRQASASNATTAKHYPTAKAGTLEVLPSYLAGSIQRYSTADGAETYTRAYTGTTWTTWKLLITSLNVFNAIYPIGIVQMFNINVNPNTAFPGTTWTRITDGAQMRASDSDASTGTVGGSDSFTLSEGQMPRHYHAGADHAHIMSHQHSGITNVAGVHRHYIAKYEAGDGQVDLGENYLCYRAWDLTSSNYQLKGNPTGTPNVGYTSSEGGHNHALQIDYFNGWTQSVSASNGGSTGTTGWAGNSQEVTHTGKFHAYSTWQRTG